MLRYLYAQQRQKLKVISGRTNMYCYHMWVPPSQCGIVGNELADQLAKRGAAEHQTENQATLHKQKALIKTIRKQRPETPGIPQMDHILTDLKITG